MPGPASIFNGGRIPVLLVIEGQEPLRESAAANAERRRATIDIRANRMPTGAQIDPDFGAVPVGGAKQGRMSLEAVQPAASEKFIIRAFAEPKDGKIPETLDGRAVFSQPRIEPILTCGNSAPLGDFTNVATALNCAVLKANGLTGKNVAMTIADTGINLAHLRNKLSGMPAFDAANSWNDSFQTLVGRPTFYPSCFNEEAALVITFF